MPVIRQPAVQKAFAHIGVDQQHPLPGLRHHHRQVGTGKALAAFRAGTGNHQNVVLGLHHGEMQAGAQAADRFHRQIRRFGHRQIGKRRPPDLGSK